MKIEIKSRFSGGVLFSHEAENNTLRVTLEAAVSGRADLRGACLGGAYLRGADLGGADLGGADLGGADLGGAYLGGADLGGAYLRGANLGGADLGGAYLRGADLGGAYLRGAYLRGADLRGAKLVGQRPVLQLWPLGSRSDYLLAFLTDAGIKIQAGCFFGTLDEFSAKVTQTHGDNEHGREYMAAIAMIRAYADIWTPSEERKEAA